MWCTFICTLVIQNRMAIESSTVPVGAIHNVSVQLSEINSTLVNGSCDECLCQMILNDSFSSFNCFRDTGTCQMYTNTNQSKSYSVISQKNSSFYFLSLPIASELSTNAPFEPTTAPRASTSTTTTSTSTTAKISTTTTFTTTVTATTTPTSAVSTTTTTRPFNSLIDLHWQETGLFFAGSTSGEEGNQPNRFHDPSCIYIDANDFIYICDHHNDRIQLWKPNATSGTTVAGIGAGSKATDLPHPEYLAFDKNGFMYVTGHELASVEKFAPHSNQGARVAGSGKAGKKLNQLEEPSALVVDDQLNLYVVDTGNKRVMRWAADATTGIEVISHSNIAGVYGIVLAPSCLDQVYLSDFSTNCIYLWTFGALNPTRILSQVNSTTDSLTEPIGMTLDRYQNLYVADYGNNRIVMYPVNSTIGIPVVEETSTGPMDVAFDSNMNMYVVLKKNQVLKYLRR